MGGRSYGRKSMGNVALPSGLRHIYGLTLQDLGSVVLPAGLKSLRVDPTYNDFAPASMSLPSGLETLFWDIDVRIASVAIPSLKELTFGDRYRHSLGNVALPHGLKSLIFGQDFDEDMGRQCGVV